MCDYSLSVGFVYAFYSLIFFLSVHAIMLFHPPRFCRFRDGLPFNYTYFFDDLFFGSGLALLFLIRLLTQRGNSVKLSSAATFTK